MLEFLTAPQNTLFATIIVVVAIFFIIEFLGVVFAGLDLAGLIDGIFPDIDLPDLDVPDADVDAGAFARILGWFSYKKVPMVITLFLLAGSLSLIGYIIQYICYKSTGKLFPWWIPTSISVVPSFLFAKISATAIGKILIQEDKWVLKKEELVGKCGIITTGTATAKLPAEAKVQGPRGKHHYIRVRPKDEGVSYPKGTHIITIRLENNVYLCIEDDSPVK